jgi:hypothetical protein
MLLKCFSSQEESKNRFVYMAGGEGPDSKATAEATEARKEAVKAKLPGETITAADMKKAADQHIDGKKLDSGDKAKDTELKEAAKKLVTENDKEFKDTVAYAAKRSEVLAIAGTDKEGVSFTKTNEINDVGTLQTETDYLQKLKEFKSAAPTNAEIKTDHDSWNKLMDAKIQDIQKQIDGYYERTITMYPDELIGKLNQQTQITDLADFTLLSSEVTRIESFRKVHFPNSTEAAKAKLDNIGKNKIGDINKALATAADKIQDSALKEQAKVVVGALGNLADATNYNLEGKDKDRWLPGAESKAEMTISKMSALTTWQNLVNAAPKGAEDPALKPYMKGGDKYANWKKAEELSKTDFQKAKVMYDNISADYLIVKEGFSKQKEADTTLTSQIKTVDSKGSFFMIDGKQIQIYKFGNFFVVGDTTVDKQGGRKQAKTPEEALAIAREIAKTLPDNYLSPDAPKPETPKSPQEQEYAKLPALEMSAAEKNELTNLLSGQTKQASFLLTRNGKTEWIRVSVTNAGKDGVTNYKVGDKEFGGNAKDVYAEVLRVAEAQRHAKFFEGSGGSAAVPSA